MTTPVRTATAVAGGAVFAGSAFAASEPSDVVLDHAGRETVRLHTRGDLAGASALALASVAR